MVNKIYLIMAIAELFITGLLFASRNITKNKKMRNYLGWAMVILVALAIYQLYIAF